MFLRNVLLILLCLFACTAATGSEYSLPDRVTVLPVAFVPKNEKSPTDEARKLFLRHLKWTQTRYRELLGDTFELADPKVQVVKGEQPVDFYRKQPEGGSPDIIAELFAHFHVTRFSCPHIYCILFMNSKDDFPEGGGRSLNGGFNTGGGMFYVSSWTLAHRPNFQSTLQHELAHSFGLPHVDTYGYDMKTNSSIMSYNRTHHTKGIMPSSTPGIFIPEDRRGLALNRRVLAKLEFDAARDAPDDYQLCKRIITLGPMKIPGHPDFYPEVTTTSGEDFSSKVSNIVREEIKPSKGPGITFDSSCMWQSEPLPNGKAVLDITFPFPVQLTGISIHSQHSGQYNEVKAVLVETTDDEKRQSVIEQSLKSIDETLKFEPTKAAHWSVTFTAGPSGCVVIRGLQFFDGTEEICPHMVPR